MNNVHPSIIILYQGLHEDNNHQLAHRWRHHVLSALPHFLGGDFPTAPLVNGSDQLAGPLSGDSDAKDVGAAGLCLCLPSPRQLFRCKSNIFSIKHFVVTGLLQKCFHQ